ncbi:MAG: ImmA/IrrE family metallo-endopeptidase [Pyrinomonadaceae bacterium]
MSEADFYRFCRLLKVTVTEMPLRVSGFYYRVMGRDFIAVDSRLTGPAKLVVMFHELAHVLFHAPESGATANFHDVGKKTRHELEADAFALCAIIPVSVIVAASSIQPLLDEGMPTEILSERMSVYERFGI